MRCQARNHPQPNEMATVATVWTHNQFIDGTTIKGHALGLKIAAGNVPSFVGRQTGGWARPSGIPSLPLKFDGGG